MSRCNYCLLQDLRRHAADTGQVVTVKPGAHGSYIYLHPPEVSIDSLVVTDLQEEPGPYFAAWLAALPDHCVC